MTDNPLKVGAFAFLFAFAFAANAVQQTLPTPPPGDCADTESSANVAVTNGPSLGRRVKLTLTANFTPSNCVQVAFGQDTDSNGDLAPEETHLVLGVDCGEPFARCESKFGGEVEEWNVQISFVGANQESNHHSSTSASDFDFSFKQPSPVAKRITHAKVTTRGRGESAAQIAAEIFRLGTALILR